MTVSSTLQSGQTLTGIYAVGGTLDEVMMTPAGFRPKLAAPIAAANFHYLAPGATSATCPARGQAAAGHVCVYSAWENGVSFTNQCSPVQGTCGSTIPVDGFVLHFTGLGPSANTRGTWAVTAP
jgi:hypothetical protein